MAQSYTAITSDSLLIDAPATLGDNFDTLFTSQSGANAPSSPEEGNLWLKVGTPSALYVYKNGAWSVIPDGDDTTKQNQNSRLDAIADADPVISSSFIPVYSSDSAVTFREAGTSGLSILQSASAAGATFVNQASLMATTTQAQQGASNTVAITPQTLAQARNLMYHAGSSVPPLTDLNTALMAGVYIVINTAANKPYTNAENLAGICVVYIGDGNSGVDECAVQLVYAGDRIWIRTEKFTQPIGYNGTLTFTGAWAQVGPNPTFESALLPTAGNIALGGQYNDIAHGLGQKPRWIRLVVACQSAIYGYSVGDEINVEWQIHRVNNTNQYAGAWAYSSGDANINIKVASDYMRIPGITNSQVDIQNTSSWKFKIYAGL